MYKHLRARMQACARRDIVAPDGYIQGGMPGRRWSFTPCGFGERSFTTNEVSCFLTGADAAVAAVREKLESGATLDDIREWVSYSHRIEAERELGMRD